MGYSIDNGSRELSLDDNFYRKDVWSVFEEYRVLLNENNLRELDDAMRDACAIMIEKGDDLQLRKAE